jgi:tRNA(Ile2) C34 agmatinyltransferase TiaS
MRQFLSALPQLGTTPQGNEMIANTLEALQQHRMAAADIGSRALAGELPTREAERMIRELPNPLELWKKSRGAAPSANPARPSQGRTQSGIGWSVD